MAIAVGVVVAGCGSSSPSSASTSGGSPKIVVAEIAHAAYTSLDPAKEAVSTSLLGNVYEMLTYWDDATSSVKPMLATSWESADGGLTWTFHIRKGVKFHDGSTCDAEAVKFSFDRTMKLGIAATFLWPIDKVEVTDPDTVVFKLTSPRPLNCMMSFILGAFIYSPTAVKTYGAKCFQGGYDAGTGPYVITSTTPTEVDMKRFKDYWGGWQGDYAKAPDVAVIRQVGEEAVRLQDLEQGVSQICGPITYNDVARLKSNPDLDVHIGPSWTDLMSYVNVKKAPTDDPYVREAIYYAMPYDEIVQLVYGGYAYVATGVAPKGAYSYDEQSALNPAPHQDLAKAKAALAKSKYPNGGVTLVAIVNAGDETCMKASQLLQAALAKLNIKLKIEPGDTGVNWQKAYSADPPDNIWFMKWWIVYPEAIAYMYESYVGTQDPPIWNLNYYSNKTVDDMITKLHGLEATDPAQAKQYAGEVYKKVMDDHPVYFMADEQQMTASSKKISGFNGWGMLYNNVPWFYRLQVNQ